MLAPPVYAAYNPGNRAITVVPDPPVRPEQDNVIKSLTASGLRFLRNRAPTITRVAPDENRLLALSELQTLDRWELERRSRLLAETIYLGDRRALCRVMGRYKMFVQTDDVGFASHAMMEGLWEPWITTFMARTLRPGMWVADIGANHGYYTLLMADTVGKAGRVLAVEPNSSTMELLARTIEINGFLHRVDLVSSALGASEQETVNLFTPPNEPKNAHVVPYLSSEGDYRSVRQQTFSELTADWPRLDFVKIDVEGAEQGVLEGGREVIERHRPTLLLEFRPSRCGDPHAILTWLKSVYGPLAELEFDGTLTDLQIEDIVADADNERMLVLSR